MMPSRSTPNLHQTKGFTSTAYHRLTQKVVPSTGGGRNDDSPPPAPPVRDSSSLKSIKYGPGHEKFPSWPVPEAAARSTSNCGSTRSKSWTDHTNYPKEKVIAYTRPYMKRQNSQYAQQKLKTVMERCEKIPPETFESRNKDPPKRLYLPNVDHDGKPLGDIDYSVPSPPEREYSKPQLTQKDLEEYAKSYQDHRLTESGLEEFMEYNNRSYEDGILTQIHHQKQVSYAQSEGYHSYVSSTDSTSTPFLDRLRRDSEAVVSRPHSSATWEEESSCSRGEGRDSVVTTSSGSASSSETLKWHGSMSDVSVASSSCTHLANSRQLIAHSARVKTPQKHHSESVLYMSQSEKESKTSSVNNKLKLFPVNTYTVQEAASETGINNSSKNRLSLSLQSALSVADRISELEKQQKYSYLDPNKKHKVPDPTLKAIQKKALLSFYERHQSASKNPWRSEPQLAQQPLSLSKPAQPKVKVSLPSRRASSASDYNSKRSSLASTLESKTTDNIIGGKITPRHQHSNSCGSLSTMGPMIIGPSISLDDYVLEKPPERPPKNPNLRSAFPDLFQQEQRVPSPDLPPPSPPTVLEHEVFDNDDPLPPPPPECSTISWREQFNDRLKSGHQVPQPQVDNNKKNSPHQNVIGIPERSMRYSLIKTRPGDHIIQQVSSKPYQSLPDKNKPETQLGFPNQRGYAERSSTRYPSTQKLALNGIADPLPIHHKNHASPGSRLETHRAQRASIAESPYKESPPPLQPRHMRINQSMRAKISHDHKTRLSPPKEGRSSSLSQSKASYLASRRDRELIVSDSETGSYKRTMSPNGHALVPEPISEPQKTNSRETVWPLIRQSRNNNSVLRKSSMKDKQQCDKNNLSNGTSTVLPDVLPVNAKMIPRSPQTCSRPQHLSFASLNGAVKKSPPQSPSKSPARSSPFAPLRTTALSSPLNLRPSPPTTSTPVRSSPQTPPHIKPSLSPSGSPIIKLSPLRTSPNSSSTATKPIEGLQMMQRTEVVLRVNTTTSDASSQTEKDELPPTPLPTRKKLQEEIECEKLSQDFVNHLPTSDRLKDLLVPGPEHKKPTDYVHGLFRVDVTLRPRSANSPFRSRNNTPSSSPPPSLNVKTTKLSLPPESPTSPLSCSSVYFTTSEPKAKFLTRFSQDMNQCHPVQDTKDLSQKKEELVGRLDKKLEVLRGEALIVSDECKINDELGISVENYINRVASPQEVAKFRLHVEEVGKITSLLLGLSGRLARAENALMTMEEADPERVILESKRDKLQDQLEEAKKLKECIDKRSIHVSNILYKYLNSEEYADYDHFINMKAKLIMDSKEINDKIKLGEEQLGALKETLIITD
ncbi:unnamed protein product [Ceutorhynchus assimilis]|uniref:ASD2 domain-containing protein n=1 Tax=Ceutorhynchus assimilis TaxID=467358 RepID=A0A9N9ME82_9CUCU|nr:unnamed protein product [Ceutorhynchus assimilis]